MDLLTVREVSQQYKSFTEPAIRYLLFHRDVNGLSAAVYRVGRKIFICREGWEQWLLNQKEEEIKNGN